MIHTCMYVLPPLIISIYAKALHHTVKNIKNDVHILTVDPKQAC